VTCHPAHLAHDSRQSRAEELAHPRDDEVQDPGELDLSGNRGHQLVHGLELP